MLISASKIITESVSLYLRNWREIGYYIALLLIVSLAMIFIQQFLFSEETLVVESLASIEPTYLAYLLYSGVSFVVYLWLSIALVKAIAKCYQDKKSAGVITELEQSANIIFSAILVSILTSIAIGVGFLLFIIPGIIATVWLLFALYIVALEHEKPITAMKESKKLVEGRWWQVFWRLLFPAFILNLAIALIEGIAIFALRVVTENLYIINSVITILGFIMLPVTIIAIVILYIELKKTPTEEVEPHPEPDKFKEDRVIAQ